MKWLSFVTNPRPKADYLSEDKQLLIKEIKKAHTDWVEAQQRFDYVTDKDQIDYAIYALEAAEKKYEMLLRSAKQMNLSVRDCQG